MREQAKPGRPREFDEDEALIAIMEVFWAKGFESSSMRDLVDATGLKKGSLYAAFGDKRQLYLKALALYDRLWIDAAVKDLSGGLPPYDRIARFLDAAVTGAPNPGDARGCFVCNAAIDQASVDPAAQAQLTASIGRMGGALGLAVSEFLGEAPDQGAIPTARHLMTVYFGLRVLRRAGAGPGVLEDAKRAALDTLTRRRPASLDN